MAALNPGEEHDRFVAWAEQNGVEINGLAPARFVGSGMGIVAARDIKAGERLAHVSNKTLINITAKAVRDLKLPKTTSVHGRLAAYFALEWQKGKASQYHLWQQVWPSKSDFEATLPIHWPKELQDLLPPSAKATLQTQTTNLAQDWSTLSPHLPTISHSLFTYTWLIINTRTFYWTYPDLPTHSPHLPVPRAQLTGASSYAMCPFIDYFNHAPKGCEAKHDKSGYAIIADREYAAGEEVWISYGAHGNCFLMAEYGFIIDGEGKDGNTHDVVSLDDVLKRKMSKEQEQDLRDDKFFGNYTLIPPSSSSSSTSTTSTSGEKDTQKQKQKQTPTATATATQSLTCHRTQSALRLLCLPRRRYASFVSGYDDGSADQHVVDAYFRDLLVEYGREVAEIIDGVHDLDLNGDGEREKKGRKRRSRRVSKGGGKAGKEGDGDGEEGEGKGVDEERKREKERVEGQRDMLVRRWGQIRRIVNDAIAVLEGGGSGSST